MTDSPIVRKCARCGRPLTLEETYVFILARTDAAKLRQDICPDCARMVDYLYRSWSSIAACLRELEQLRRKLKTSSCPNPAGLP